MFKSYSISYTADPTVCVILTVTIKSMRHIMYQTDSELGSETVSLEFLYFLIFVNEGFVSGLMVYCMLLKLEYY